jgi:formylglycine-generating enzyme required for sulfatase activity
VKDGIHHGSHDSTKGNVAPVRRLLMIASIVVPVVAGIHAIDRHGLVFNISAESQKAAGPQGPCWTNSVGMTFVRIPSGTFTMGSNSSEADRHEKPPHTVTISRPFYMATTEVTQAQWEAVVGGNPSKFQGVDLPVEQVSWYDTKEFIRKLNIKDGCTRYRLPTEAEWEYACRAGTTGPWYGDLDSIAWYDPNSGSTTHPVGQKLANAWGLNDMLGNVYEWCEDWREAYAGENATDPRGPSSGWARVVRGGSWLIHANRARSYFRDFFPPDERRDDIGFRVVADARTP